MSEINDLLIEQLKNYFTLTIQLISITKQAQMLLHNRPRSISVTWLRGFQVKPLYLVLFSLYLSLFWELRDKGNLKNLQFWPETLRAMLEYWYIERGLLAARCLDSHPQFPHFWLGMSGTDPSFGIPKNNLYFLTYAFLWKPE